jgi:hypothetical protein
MRISLENLEGSGYLVEYGPGRTEILIREGDPHERRRYTIAHELGHWFLINMCGLKNSRNLETEAWCNRFAASALMPVEWIERYFEPALFAEYPTLILNGPALFDVSAEAFRIRAANVLGLSIASVRPSGDAWALIETFGPWVDRVQLESSSPTPALARSIARGMEFAAIELPRAGQSDWLCVARTRRRSPSAQRRQKR